MDEAELRQFDIHLPPVRVHYDFRPIKIRVYRNGDELDNGKDVTVTRREFKHWIIFLDALTKKLGTTTAINRLHTTNGERIDHFDELQPKGEYVAIEKGAFIHCNYGRKWATNLKAEEKQPHFLNSAETMDIYLKHEGYGSYTGLPYPLDSILAKSPSTSALHIQSHLHAEKFGGSLEKLNKVGKYIWDDDGNGGGETKQKTETTPVIPTGVIQLPKLVGLSDSSSKHTVKEASVENITLPVIVNPVQTIKPKPETSMELSQRKMEENGKEERKERVSEEKETTRQRKERKGETETRAGKRTSKETAQKQSLEDRAEESRPAAGTQEESQENVIVPFLVQGKSRKKVFNIPTPQPNSSNRISAYESEKKKGPGVERIFERSERRIIRELSDDRDEIYKPSRQIVASTSSYKSYLWEARRPYDPDLDY